MEALNAWRVNYSIFFYNPNIHPEKEYLIRKEENIRIAQDLGVPFIDADYDRSYWFKRIEGYEHTPERGARCTLCFDMRFERTALYAYEHGFDVISSCLGISRWKDFRQVSTSGMMAASRYPGLIYWAYPWRRDGGSARMLTLAKEKKFYQQEYCGCVYSLRDTHHRRAKKDRARIEFGKKYYGPKEAS